MKPNIVVTLLTYNRLDYALKTLEAFFANAKYSGNMFLHIADDGSPEGYVDTIIEAARGYQSVKQITNSCSERGGYGRNYNLSTQITHAIAGQDGFILPLEDDWLLERELDLDLLVDDLQSQYQFDCIRLGYLGMTKSFRADVFPVNDRHYMHLLASSPETHVFAGHPRLESVAFEQRLGAWPEGIGAGETELVVCSYETSRDRIAWPLWLVSPYGNLFGHIGEVKAVNPN